MSIHTYIHVHAYTNTKYIHTHPYVNCIHKNPHTHTRNTKYTNIHIHDTLIHTHTKNNNIHKLKLTPHIQYILTLIQQTHTKYITPQTKQKTTKRPKNQ